MSALETYFHIYNRGVEHRLIFASEEDYEVFLGFLKDYLDSPRNPESVKRSFTVNGRTFQGIPHQPKNYFGKIELVTLSLEPDSFHLLLKEKVEGSIPNFVRSLCTRYSMYFNKKYSRTGPLFVGPYKSSPVKDKAEFLQQDITKPKQGLKTPSRMPEFVAAVAVFLLLVGLSVRNINISAMVPTVLSDSVQPTASPEPEIVLAIKITDGATSVNIRREPTVQSEKIGEAEEGATFEFVSINSGWYEVKLADGSTGFVSAKYLEIIEETNN